MIIIPTYNRKCRFCGEEYYCCSSCLSNTSWKNLYCSIECFLQSQDGDAYRGNQPLIINQGGNNMKVVLRGVLKTGATCNIIGYDLDLGKFDCASGTTRTLEEFNYFIVPESEMNYFTLKSNNAKKVEDKIKLSKTNKKEQL